MRGAGIGTVIGLFGGLVGLLLGPFFGAWIGEWWVKKDWGKSLKPAFGSLVGILISGILKVAICIFL